MYDMKNLAKLKKMGELAPEGFKGFLAFDEAAFKEGAIPKRRRSTSRRSSVRAWKEC